MPINTCVRNPVFAAHLPFHANSATGNCREYKTYNKFCCHIKMQKEQQDGSTCYSFLLAPH